MDDKFLEEALLLSRDSTCHKTKIGVILVKDGRIIAQGTNTCSPKAKICPRMFLKSGTRYDLCRSIHAEVLACLSVRKRNLKELAAFSAPNKPSRKQIMAAFTHEELEILRGASLYLAGHFYVCPDCTFFLKTLGITEIYLDPESSDKTEVKYKNNRLV